VLSAGFDVYWAAGAAVVPSYFPDVDLGGSSTVDGVEVSARELDPGFAGSWWLARYGICAS